MSNCPINHPSHYTQGSLEVIDAIEGLELPYHEGNVLKYIARWKFKNGIEDLQKARWYLDRLIEQAEKGRATKPADPAKMVAEAQANFNKYGVIEENISRP